MKKIFFTFFFMSNLIAHSQTYFEFPNDSSTWSYSVYYPISTTMVTCYQVDNYGIFGDTSINAVKYSKLYNYNEGGDNLNNSNPGFILQNANYIGALRNDNAKKVHYLEANESEEYVLFDFGLNVGDTFCFKNQVNGYSVVSSIDSQLINGNQYRRSINFYNQRWVEGIGNWYYGFFGKPSYTWGFNCHSNRGKQLVGVVGDCSCSKGDIITNQYWIIVSVEDYLKDNKIEIFPNPTSGRVNISLGKTYQMCILFINDLNGKMIFHKKYINTDLVHFDISSYHNGSYNVCIETEIGLIGKLLIKK